MKKLFLIFSLITIHCSLFAQSWAWGKYGDDSGSVTDVWGVAADNNGNVFFAGSYPTDITFGNITLYTTGSNTFLVKYDTAGNVLWAKQSVTPSPYSIAAASTVATDYQGNAYMTGWFMDTASFGPYMLTTQAGSIYGAVFLVKYDPSGNVLWAKQSVFPSSSCYGFGNCVTTDASGNVYIGGLFADTASFGPYTLTSPYLRNIFLVKYSPAGTVLWARQSVAPTLFCGGNALSLTTDKFRNVFMAGLFADTLSLGPYTLKGVSHWHQGLTYIAKYDSNGNIKWAKQALSPGGYGYNSANSVVTDSRGNSYVTGFFTDTCVFGSAKLITDSVIPQAFLVKYDISGNQVWAKQSYSISSTRWQGFSLAIDKWNEIFFSGGSMGGSNCSITFGGDTLTSTDIGDISYIMKIDTGANVQCGSTIASGGDDYNTVATDPSGRFVYLGGDLFQDMIFGKDTIIAPSGEEAFIARWNPCNPIAEGVNKLNDTKEDVEVYPNPNDGVFAIKSSVDSHKSTVEIYNTLGQKVYNGRLTMNNGQCYINLSTQANGVYLYRIVTTSGKQLADGKFIINK